jgi:hypothetical protein
LDEADNRPEMAGGSGGRRLEISLTILLVLAAALVALALPTIRRKRSTAFVDSET